MYLVVFFLSWFGLGYAIAGLYGMGDPSQLDATMMYVCLIGIVYGSGEVIPRLYPKPSQRSIEMRKVGERFAKYLPGYRLLGVDPGYLFVPKGSYYHGGVDIPEHIVKHLLKQLEDK